MRIPYVKVTISRRGKRRSDISTNLFFSELYVLPKQGTHFGRRHKKREKEKKIEKVKKVSKGRKIQNGPQSGTKQSIWRGYKTGLDEVM